MDEGEGFICSFRIMARMGYDNMFYKKVLS